MLCKIFRLDLNETQEEIKLSYFASTAHFFYRSSDHRCCHGISRTMQVFYAIQLLCSVRRRRRDLLPHAFRFAAINFWH